MSGRGRKYFLTTMKWSMQNLFNLWNGNLIMFFLIRNKKKKVSKGCHQWTACLKIYVRKSSMLFMRPLQKMLFCQNISIKKWRYLLNCWKTGRHIGKECQCFHRKINEIASSVFNWFCNQNDLLSQNYFLISKYQNKFLFIIWLLQLF